MMQPPSAALLAAAAVSLGAIAAPVTAQVTLRDTLPFPLDTTPYNNHTLTVAPAGAVNINDISGIYFSMGLTVTPEQSQHTANLTFAASITFLSSANSQVTAVSGHFNQGQVLSNRPLPIIVHWWNAAIFTPTNISLGYVGSESVGRVMEVPPLSGRDNLNRNTFLMNYNLNLPATNFTTTYIMAFAMEGVISSGAAMRIMTTEPREGLLFESGLAPDYRLAGTSLNNPFSYNPVNARIGEPRLGAVRITIPSIPGPGGLAVLGLAGVFAARRQRQ